MWKAISFFLLCFLLFGFISAKAGAETIPADMGTSTRQASGGTTTQPASGGPSTQAAINGLRDGSGNYWANINALCANYGCSPTGWNSAYFPSSNATYSFPGVTYCPSGFTLSGSTCTSNAPYTCPDSTWTLSGSTCSKTIPYSCLDSTWTLSGSTCSKTWGPTCPDDSYQLSSDRTQCYRPDGDPCAKFSGSEMPGGGQISSSSPDYICQEAFYGSGNEGLNAHTCLAQKQLRYMDNYGGSWLYRYTGGSCDPGNSQKTDPINPPPPTSPSPPTCSATSHLIFTNGFYACVPNDDGTGGSSSTGSNSSGTSDSGGSTSPSQTPSGSPGSGAGVPCTGSGGGVGANMPGCTPVPCNTTVTGQPMIVPGCTPGMGGGSGSGSGSGNASGTVSNNASGTAETCLQQYGIAADMFCGGKSPLTDPGNAPNMPSTQDGGDISQQFSTADQYFGGAACPAPYVAQIHIRDYSGSVSIPFDVFCQYAGMIKPAVLLAAALFSMFIVFKRG